MKKLFYLFIMALLMSTAVAFAQNDPFITRWDLTEAGSGANQLSLGVTTSGTVNYTWTTVPAGTSGSGTFTGSTATISGLPANSIIDLSIAPTNFQRININNGLDKSRLIQVKQWGDVAWTSMETAFYECNNLTLTATDVPNTANVTNMSYMFFGCSSFNQALPNSFNTANVTDMSNMFRYCSSYNQPLPSGFNIVSVTDMNSMFNGCSAYNQPLPSSFNTANVTNMQGMFYGCGTYNQALPSSFTTANVTDMSYMFYGCSAYNQPLPSSFNTAKVTNMSFMFQGCSAYNQPLPSSFNTVSVTDMTNMFYDCSAYNQALPSSFNTVSVTDMTNMFYGCSAYNQPLPSSFNTANVTEMPLMFNRCSVYNQAFPSSFTTANVTNMAAMFLNCSSYNQALPSSFNTANVTNMRNMFQGCSAYNQPLPSSFTTANVTNMNSMFLGATAFNQNLGTWNIGATTDMRDMLKNSGMSITNYDNTLIGWNNGGYTNKNLGSVSPLTYCAAQSARADLLTKGWTITGDTYTNACTPEINLKGNGVTIAGGGNNTPSSSDGTNFGPAAVTGGTITRTFTIENTGTGALTLNTNNPRVTLSGHTTDFTVTTQPSSSSIAANGSLDFVITFDPTTTGIRTATVSIANDDANENPYTFAIQGTGTAPEINVKGNGNSIASGSYSPELFNNTNFGITPGAGGSIVKTFTIENTGTADLNLTGSPIVSITGSHASDFVVTQLPTSPVAAGNGKTTFEVTFTPSTLGLRQAFINIYNNDSDENFYNFQIQGYRGLPFITRWDLAGTGASATQLSFGVATAGNVEYIWSEVGGLGRSGSGFFSGTTAVITGLPSGAIIDLNIFPVNFQRININSGSDSERLKEIKQWGEVEWTSMENAFAGCFYVTGTATDVPDLRQVTNMSRMFYFASAFNQGISSWHVDAVANMSSMFENALAFNQDISSWHVNSVTNMSSMLRGARAFNQNIGSWNVTNVTNMSSMFLGARAFNQSLAAWGTKLNANVNLVNFLDNCGLSLTNYDATLIGFNAGTVTGRSLGALGLQYCASVPERNNLINAKGWTITGDTQAPSCLSSEINLKGNSVTIENGDVSPIITDHTDFGPASVTGGTVTRTFTIENKGTGDLTLGTVTGATSDFNITQPLLTTLPANSSTTFTVTFDPTAAGKRMTTISIANNDTDENPYTFAIEGYGGRPFITTWNAGFITIPTTGTGYNYDVDWNNDGIYDEFGVTGNTTHNYGTAGTYTVAIRGSFPRIFFDNDGTNNEQLLSLVQWGDIDWKSMQRAFYGCNNLQINANDTPDLDDVTDMSGMFTSISAINQDITGWEVGQVTNMGSLFGGVNSFNQDISGWNVGNVTNMSSMFAGTAFNQDISGWNISNVLYMGGMFGQSPFNKNISGWDVSNVTNMSLMFSQSTAFNQDIGAWNVANVTDMSNMFFGATSFNQSLAAWGTRLNANVNLTNFLNNCGMSITNYDATLTGFRAGTVTGRTMGAAGLQFCASKADRDHLVLATGSGGKGWTISNDAQTTSCLSADINLKGNTITIDNSDTTPSITDHTDFGPAKVTGGTVMRTFTIENTGTGALTLGTVTGATSDFSITQPLLTTLPAGGNTTFTVTFDPTATGKRTTTISIANNDTDANPYTFAIEGYGGKPFITTWKTNNLSTGSSTGTSITIPTTGSGYNYDVDWNNDGIYDEFGKTGSVTHDYGTSGTYTVAIRGSFPRIYFNNGGDKAKILSMDQWGDITWTSMGSAFYGCSNLTIPATDVPNLTGVTDMSQMFRECTSFTQALPEGFNTASVTNMQAMFYGCSAYNYSLPSSFTTANVTDMSYMFAFCSAYNRPLPSSFTTANVTDMSFMFRDCSTYNRALPSSFNTVSVRNMLQMFENCRAYNQALPNSFNTASVEDMSEMFFGCSAYNQAFPSNFTTASVTNMSAMFSGAAAFDQNLGALNLEKTTTMTDMLKNSGLSIDNYDATLIGWNTAGYTNKNLGDALPLRYCAAQSARAELVTRGWIINNDTYTNACLTAEINLKGNGVTIENGDSTPRITDHTDFGPTSVTGGTVTRTFTIENTGTSDLLLGSNPVSKSGANAADFTIAQPALTTIPAGGNTTFTVTFDPSAAGVRTATVSIANNDADETPYIFAIQGYGGRPFITTWKTNNTGASNSTSLRIPTTGSGYNYDVDWNNDGIYDEFGKTGNVTHDYGTAGTYTVAIRGRFPRIYFNGGGDKDKILSVDQWGDIAWTSMGSAFLGCSNLTLAASDVPNTAGVTDMSYMFANCGSFNQALPAGFNTANVTTMQGMFYACLTYNQALPGSFNTANVTDMRLMFANCWAYDQAFPAGFITANVRNMSSMFQACRNFNQVLPAHFTTDNVTNMSAMFSNCFIYNQALPGTFRTTNVIAMSSMFQDCFAYDQVLPSSFNTANVTEMIAMFSGCRSYNKALPSSFNTASATSMIEMFYGATAFNQALPSSFNTANVTDMSGMFYDATAFNQNLGAWNIGAAIDMTNMLKNSGLSVDNYDATLIGWNTAGYTNKNLGDASPLKYCPAQSARNNMIDNKGWRISGDTYAAGNCCVLTVSFSGTNPVCQGSPSALLPNTGGTWTSNDPAKATVTAAGQITTLLPGTVTFTFTTPQGCTAVSPALTIKPTPSSALTASKVDVCPNSEVTLDAHCSLPTATVHWNPGAPTVTPDAATIPYLYKASCVADGCVGNESSVEVRTHRILVDMKDLDVGTLPLPIARAVKDNMAPTNVINAPVFPRRWTFIATGCNASESAVFRLLGPVSFQTVDNEGMYAMFGNDGGGFYSLDHPNYGNGGSFPNGTYTLTVDLRSSDGVGGPFPKNRVAAGSLLATRSLQFTVQNPVARMGMSPEPFAAGSEGMVQVIPNPVVNTMRLHVSDSRGETVNIELLDTWGRNLLQGHFVALTDEHQEEFDLSHLSNGLYFLRVKTGNKQTIRKVVKVQ